MDYVENTIEFLQYDALRNNALQGDGKKSNVSRLIRQPKPLGGGRRIM